jgi:hypothetical protein
MHWPARKSSPVMILDVTNAGRNVLAKSKVKRNPDRLALLKDRMEFSSL